LPFVVVMMLFFCRVRPVDCVAVPAVCARGSHALPPPTLLGVHVSEKSRESADGSKPVDIIEIVIDD